MGLGIKKCWIAKGDGDTCWYKVNGKQKGPPSHIESVAL